ncbi:hypothetical protein BGZ54_007654 [Gamsiella multidivaricata]|nr:hypothetical protein BGZ54_007654 [Gamsiella multidivaricata]
MPKHHSVKLKGRIIGAHEADGTVVPKKQPGRPPILGELDVEQPVNKVKSDNRMALQEIVAESPKPVSKNTLRRVLHNSRIFCRVVVKKPRLEPRHVEQRLQDDPHLAY